MSDFALSFGRLEAVLSAYFRIDPERSGTFRARIKQLQRLNFPSGVNVGRGVKFEYELDHCLKLVVALEFMALGLPAKFVSDIIEAGWRRLAIGFQVSPIAWLEAEGSDEIFARLKMDLLADAYNPAEAVYIYDLDHFDNNVVRDGQSILSINLTAVFRQFVKCLDLIRLNGDNLSFTIRQWDTGFRELSNSWDHDWLEVSHSWLERFKPKARHVDS